MKKLIVAVMAIAILAMAGVAMAADTASVDVSATVVGTCKFNSNAEVAFGILDQTSSADATAVGNVVFWCTKNSVYTLGDEANPLVGDGAFSGTLTGPETIAYTLSYNNYSGSGAGKTSPITSTIGGTIANANYVNAAAGSYTDIVTFTINP